MPVTTRSAGAADTPSTDPEWFRKVLNHTDPITLEPVLEARRVFLQPCPKRDRYHAYDADALARYICDTATRTSPLTREPFTSAELARISQRAGLPRGFLRAAIRFHPWAALLPSPTMLAAQPVDALAAYLEAAVAVADHRHGADMVELVLAPKMHAAVRAIHAAAHLPPVPQVLDALKPALRRMARGGVRSFLSGMLRGVRRHYECVQKTTLLAA